MQLDPAQDREDPQQRDRRRLRRPARRQRQLGRDGRRRPARQRSGHPGEARLPRPRAPARAGSAAEARDARVRDPDHRLRQADRRHRRRRAKRHRVLPARVRADGRVGVRLFAVLGADGAGARLFAGVGGLAVRHAAPAGVRARSAGGAGAVPGVRDRRVARRAADQLHLEGGLRRRRHRDRGAAQLHRPADPRHDGAGHGLRRLRHADADPDPDDPRARDHGVDRRRLQDRHQPRHAAGRGLLHPLRQPLRGTGQPAARAPRPLDGRGWRRVGRDAQRGHRHRRLRRPVRRRLPPEPGPPHRPPAAGRARAAGGLALQPDAVRIVERFDLGLDVLSVVHRDAEGRLLRPRDDGVRQPVRLADGQRAGRGLGRLGAAAGQAGLLGLQRGQSRSGRHCRATPSRWPTPWASRPRARACSTPAARCCRSTSISPTTRREPSRR